MRQFTVSIYIHRPQQDVFDFLSNPANISKWDSDFESAEWLSSGSPGIGSTYRASGKRIGSEKDGFFEIVQWDRPHSYSYQVKERMFLFDRAETTFTLTPKQDGTETTCESQFEIMRKYKFAEGFIAWLGKKRIEANLSAARRLLEAG